MANVNVFINGVFFDEEGKTVSQADEQDEQEKQEGQN